MKSAGMYVALYHSPARVQRAGIPHRRGVARLRVDRLSAPLARPGAPSVGGQRIRFVSARSKLDRRQVCEVSSTRNAFVLLPVRSRHSPVGD